MEILNLPIKCKNKIEYLYFIQNLINELLVFTLQKKNITLQRSQYSKIKYQFAQKPEHLLPNFNFHFQTVRKIFQSKIISKLLIFKC